MQVEIEETERRVTITLTQDEHDRLRRCAEYREVTPEHAVAAYLSDWIEMDFATASGRYSRRMLYRDDPPMLGAEGRR